MKKLLIPIFIFISLEVNASGLWANRFVTYDFLKNIFGPNSSSILEDKILSEPQVFGGACSLMEANFSKDRNNSTLYYCRTGSAESKTRAYANDLIRRNALIHTACQKLTANNDTFDFLFSQTLIYADWSARGKNIFKRFYPFTIGSIQNFQKIYKMTREDLSFPYRLSSIPTTFFNEKEVLRRLTYYYCISEKWQKL